MLKQWQENQYKFPTQERWEKQRKRHREINKDDKGDKYDDAVWNLNSFEFRPAPFLCIAVTWPTYLLWVPNNLYCISTTYNWKNLKNTMYLPHFQILKFVEYKGKVSIGQTSFFSSMHTDKIDFLKNEGCFLNALLHINLSHSYEDNIKGKIS